VHAVHAASRAVVDVAQVHDRIVSHPPQVTSTTR
jgi:hypothetical protein